jgi:hypothetical protein
MPQFKGRALIYPLLLVATWIVARSFSHTSMEVPGALAATTEPQVAFAAQPAAAIGGYCAGWPDMQPSLYGQSGSGGTSVPSYYQRPVSYIYSPRIMAYRDSTRQPESGALPAPPARGWFPDAGFRLSDIPMAGFAPSAAAAPTGQSPSVAPPPIRRFQLYAYNFFRQGRGGGGLAPGAQYGGTQAGAIATWDPFGKPGTGPAILMRASTAPNSYDREVALGARWKPDADMPLSLSLERRFRFGTPDSFAAYAAGGVDRVPIMGKLKLDAYGQAGYALGGGSSYFFDAQGRMMYPLFDVAGMPVEFGAGGWAGGQRGVQRFDIGPTLSADVNTKLAKFKLYVDWRKRMAGNAEPADGLALTAAAGF